MSKDPFSSSYWAHIFVIRSYHRAVIVSFGRLSSPARPTLHLDFQMFHSVIEAMVGLISLNLFKHQICNSLTSCTMHLFFHTQNAFRLPKSHDIQVFSPISTIVQILNIWNLATCSSLVGVGVERQAQHRPDRLSKPRTGSVGTDHMVRIGCVNRYADPSV